MKYAIVNGIKQEALNTGERGTCIYCGAKMVSYCGKFIINHWEHKSKQDCDSWYEPETEWHRSWKDHFPKEFQEVIKFDENTGEKHIADIYNNRQNLTIEIQHSTISLEEIESRESFYKKMLWIVDLTQHKKNIFLHIDINSAFHEEVVMRWANDWDRKRSQLEKAGNFEKVNQMLASKWEDQYINSFEKKYKSNCKKDDYYLLQWKYQHKRWNNNSVPLFFDLGDEFIYLSIEPIKIWNGFVVKQFTKLRFIQKYKL